MQFIQTINFAAVYTKQWDSLEYKTLVTSQFEVEYCPHPVKQAQNTFKKQRYKTKNDNTVNYNDI